MRKPLYVEKPQFDKKNRGFKIINIDTLFNVIFDQTTILRVPLWIVAWRFIVNYAYSPFIL